MIRALVSGSPSRIRTSVTRLKIWGPAARRRENVRDYLATFPRIRCVPGRHPVSPKATHEFSLDVVEEYGRVPHQRGFNGALVSSGAEPVFNDTMGTLPSKVCRMMREIATLLLASVALSACTTLAPVADALGGPDPATYLPRLAVVNDAVQYTADVKACRDAVLGIPDAFSVASAASTGGKAAVQSLPAAAASAPLYGVEIGSAVGANLWDQATGAREPKMAALMTCIRQYTTEDRSAVLADPH